MSGLSSVNDLANALNGMFNQMPDLEGATGVSNVRFAPTEAADNSLTVTYTDANGKVCTAEVPELELPEGELTAETLMSVLGKIDDASDDISLSPEALESLNKAATEYLKSLEGKLELSPKLKSGISVYDIMAEVTYLLIECANEQAKAARSARHAAQLQQYAMTLSMAAAQEKNAFYGMLGAVVSGALQGVVTVVMSGGSKDVAKVKEDNGVQASLNNLSNSELMGDPVKAQAAMQGTANSLKIPETTQAEVQTVLGGESVTVDGKTMPEAAKALTDYQLENSSAYAEAKGDLPGAKANLEAKQAELAKLEQQTNPPATKEALAEARQGVADAKTKVDALESTISDYEGTVAKYKQGVRVADAKAKLAETLENPSSTPEEIKAAQDAYRQEVDKAVDLYKQDADTARAEYMAVRDNPNSTTAEIEAAREKLSAAQNNWQYASAARTNVLSQTIGGRPVISESGIQAELNARKDEFAKARTRAADDPAMEKAMSGMDPMTRRELALSICRALDGAYQNFIKRWEVEATLKGADKTKAEQDITAAEEWLQDARELIKAALQEQQAQGQSIRGATMV